MADIRRPNSGCASRLMAGWWKSCPTAKSGRSNPQLTSGRASRRTNGPAGGRHIRARPQPAGLAAGRPCAAVSARPKTDADYARAIRAATKLTQAEFAARIGVPIETVRNWEQGKRSPRGPARALLKVIEQAPDLAFAALAPSRARP